MTLTTFALELEAPEALVEQFRGRRAPVVALGSLVRLSPGGAVRRSCHMLTAAREALTNA